MSRALIFAPCVSIDLNQFVRVETNLVELSTISLPYPVTKRTGSFEQSPPVLDEESALVKRCQAGERAAFEEFYRTHRKRVAAVLFKVLGDKSELEDLVQEVFVVAFRGLEQFRGDAKLGTWLYRICVNVALGRIRTKSRRPRTVSVEVGIYEAADGGLSPEEALLQNQNKAKVYKAFEAMSPKKRMVLFLHEIEGMDLKEIAYLVGSNAVTVRTRLFYARKEFYKLIVEDAS